MSYKFFNKLTFFLALAVLLFAGSAADASAATRTVTKAADTNDNICNADCSLREAIAAAVSGDKIVFQPALAGQTIQLLLGVIEIDKNLVVTGADNLKISGSFTSRIFFISSGANVTINNLGLKNGVAQYPDVLPSTGEGGAILVAGNSALTINNSKLYSNHGVSGGAIASYGALKIYNTQIYSNSAEFSGGGVSTDALNSTVEIIDSIIKNNQALWGGGVNITDGTFKMVGTSVYGNTATSDSLGGGGLYLTGYNYFPTGYGTNFMIADSTISGNSANDGGGIYNLGNLALVNSTLSGNEATANGGGLYHLEPSNTPAGVLWIKNATITANTAIASGGGIYRHGNTGGVNLGNTLVAANSNFNLSSPDVKGTVNSLGYNLFGSMSGALVLGNLAGNQINPNPMLAPLDNYGGKTKTHLPDLASPAVNAGSNILATDANGFALGTDQRG
jgi:CSLREA domain-containing protein